jgi:hypothetical protein
VSHPGGDWTAPISRAVVAGPRLFTISDFGVRASALDSFVPTGWAAFPRPPESPIAIDAR